MIFKTTILILTVIWFTVMFGALVKSAKDEFNLNGPEVFVFLLFILSILVVFLGGIVAWIW